jgi:hypothetical protein
MLARSKSSTHDCKLFTAGTPAATSANSAFLLSVAGVGPRGWLRMTKKSGFTVTVSGFYITCVLRCASHPKHENADTALQNASDSQFLEFLLAFTSVHGTP